MEERVFSGNFESLAVIGEFIEELAQTAGFNEKDVYALQLAVDEACSNIIEHAYGGEGRGDIYCECDDSAVEFKITLKDYGNAFNPDEISDPDYNLPLEEINSRGAGLMMMRKIMDSVEFKFSKAEGNILVMTKKKN